jgi:hypothetical protein
MYGVLLIDGAAVAWTVDIPDLPSTAQEIAQATDPIVLPALLPAGAQFISSRLVLSPQAVGTVTLTELPAPGWIPSYAAAPQARIYLPSVAQAADALHGYALAAGTDPEQLESDVIDAIRNGATLTLDVTADSGQSVVVLLNGARLSFVVIVPAG